MTATVHRLEVNPRIPPRLARLDELANNLWYSWDRPTRDLFASLSRELWRSTGRNPKALLRRVSQRKLEAAAADPDFLARLERVLSAFDAYHAAPELAQALGRPLDDDDLVAYFCAEFGLHESLPIYSGGLGILAGDHCKAASDTGLPFVGVGLLYRQGYFSQTIDGDGRQQVSYCDADFGTLPISAVCGADGAELRIAIDLPGRDLQVRVWQVQVGRVRVLLLDSALPENDEHDRDITSSLYGGDRVRRIEQEIVLGVGGVRALAALGLEPTVWHVNEGHSAFLILERIRRHVEHGLPYAAALEAVAANVVFTTHTAVAAGHDHFPDELMRRYFAHWRGSLGVTQLFALGAEAGQPDFNMTALAIRGSRHHNGVSRIHGQVSSQISSHLWPQIAAAENPITHVTNGIHLQSFLSQEWRSVFESFIGADWLRRHRDPASWNGLFQIPDDMFWSVHKRLKSQLFYLVRQLLREQHQRNQGSPSHLDRLLRLVDPEHPNVLTIGFARRFATYKRAALLFQDPDWLREIISQAGRPVLFLFAGKAHPDDQPGQETLRRIAELSARPEFEGRVLLLEEYGLHLARRMVAGVDVWLNNPVYPLEASGTSGMKAAINGAINLSLLDGWWGEGHVADPSESNGWAIPPSRHADPQLRDAEEARSLYEILQDQVVPTYYRTAGKDCSPEWVALAKRSIASVAPRFSVIRMLDDYVHKLYLPASAHGRRLAANDYAGARELAGWKERVQAAWPGVRLARVSTPTGRVGWGDPVRIEVALQLNGLATHDVAVEALLDWPDCDDASRRCEQALLAPAGSEGGEAHYALDLKSGRCGRLEYRIRAYPSHELLAHRFELGLMAWL